MTTQLVPATSRPKVTRDPPFMRWFFRIPIGLYRIGLADQLGRSTLLLTTRGRKTGRQRVAALNYVIDNGVTYVLAGHGLGSDWLRNIQADPLVQVEIGRKRFAAHGEMLIDPSEHRRVLSLWVERSLRTAPPVVVRRFMRRFGFDYEEAARRHLEQDPPPPIVALRPVA